MNKIKSVLFIVIIALLFMGIGCVDKQSKIKEVRVGYQPTTHHIAEFIAIQKAWFAEDTGILFTDKEFIGGAPEMEAMMAGELDIAYVGATPAINAIAKGLEAKIVASANNEGSALVMRNDFNYTSPQDLVGRKIGTLPRPSIQDTVLRVWLLNNGINSEDVDIKFMSGADMLAGLSSGAIDGFIWAEPGPTQAEMQGIGKIVVNSSEMWMHPCCVVVVSDKLIKEEPDLVKKIVKTHIKAMNYISENETETVNISSNKLKLSPEILKKSLESGRTKYDPDPRKIESGIKRFSDDLVELKIITRPMNTSDLFDFTFYDQANTSP
ncbi:MAG: ABC transporter substrate-binding protein [Candidatus Methanoperedens sp.]|nr:ABC transporter substrate-binding protein [Candidatus Methanoperedens sp.]